MRVLLVANVGGGKAGFYHVGDEAMFYQWYTTYLAGRSPVMLGTFLPFGSASYPDIESHPQLPWPSHPRTARQYFYKLLFKVLLLKITHLSHLSPEQQSCIETIKKYDRIHFTGGGNITSTFPSWLYYTYFIIFVSWIFNKEVVLTSQTIGPFTPYDTGLSSCMLNLVKKIQLRERVTNNWPLLKFGIIRPKISSAVDAATHLHSKSTYRLPKNSSAIRIGLSLHGWKNFGDQIEKKTLEILAVLHIKYHIEVVLIPHLFTRNMQQWDSGFMRQLVKKLPADIRVMCPTYEELTTSAVTPACTIKALTASVDVLISSRYHGLVFALATGTPFIGFLMDDYYNRKNAKLLDFYTHADPKYTYIRLKS